VKIEDFTMQLTFLNAIFFVFAHTVGWLYFRSFGFEYFVHADLSSGYYYVLNHPFGSAGVYLLTIATIYYSLQKIFTVPIKKGWVTGLQRFMANQFFFWPLVMISLSFMVEFKSSEPQARYTLTTENTSYACVSVLGRLGGYTALLKNGSPILIRASDVIQITQSSCSNPRQT